MIPPGARVWIAMGHTDMRKGMQGLAMIVQQAFGCNAFRGDLFVFRGRAGSLVKIIWPSANDGIVALTASQLACLLDGNDWGIPY